jgi:hypothetical protein
VSLIILRAIPQEHLSGSNHLINPSRTIHQSPGRISNGNTEGEFLSAKTTTSSQTSKAVSDALQLEQQLAGARLRLAEVLALVVESSDTSITTRLSENGPWGKVETVRSRHFKTPRCIVLTKPLFGL